MKDTNVTIFFVNFGIKLWLQELKNWVIEENGLNIYTNPIFIITV